MKYLLIVLFSIGSTALFSQVKQFNGTWTKLNTTYEFEFDLILNIKNSNQLEGYFVWRVVNYDNKSNLSRQYYEKKIGMTAKEYVTGTYDHLTGAYTLKGYKKEDPFSIIALDIYKLILDRNGDIGGTTNSNGTWLGRINGKHMNMKFL